MTGSSNRGTPRSDNVVWDQGRVDRDHRRRLLGHRPATLWFTGLSGSGKSTLAFEVEGRLADRGVVAYVLDGDNLRHGLSGDLGFAPEDRQENIRRVGHVSRLFCEAGLVVLTAFISPYTRDRRRARELHPEGEFFEIHLDAPIEVCERRDPKGLYQRARAGEIPEFSGVSAPYEAPDRPELRIDTAGASLDDGADAVLDLLERHGIIAAR